MKLLQTIFLIIILIIINSQRYGRIIENVINLREEKKEHSLIYIFDRLQNTQLLFNECVQVLEIDNEWVKVSSLLQQRYF
jgi:hypothetical protein